MKNFWAVLPVLVWAGCSQAPEPSAFPGGIPGTTEEEGYRGIEKATLLAKGME